MNKDTTNSLNCIQVEIRTKQSKNEMKILAEVKKDNNKKKPRRKQKILYQKNADKRENECKTLGVNSTSGALGDS